MDEADAGADPDPGAGGVTDGDAAESPGEEGNGPPDDLDPERREERTAAFYDALESVGRPVATAGEVARRTELSHDAADDLLAALPDANRLDVSNDPVVWYPEDLETLTDRERVVVFPDRREVVVDQPDQYTLARLSGFARLVTTSGEGSYIYEVRDSDVWAAPHEDLGELIAAMRSVLGRWERLEEWVRAQYERTRKFRLRTDGDDDDDESESESYTVLEAASEDLMGNVARQKLDDDLVRGLVSDTEAWVVEGEEAAIKRQLYDAGYPVRDDRRLDEGDDLSLDLELELRDYQRDWVDRFTERGAGVLVGPPGSGKTVAAMGVMAAIEGETLVLVPSRELAGQWHDELLSKTTLSPGEVGEYHGGTKEMAPVTIATYQTAGMDRHRELFDARRWGLIVYDEVQHVPAPIARRSAELQSKSRLGLSATPVREDDKESEIFTLVGPPIGTDWTALFEAGYVARPEVEIRYVPWDPESRDEYAAASGHRKRQVAASNPAKVRAVENLLDETAGKALVFVDYLDQGEAIAEALEVPFVSGETRHARRAKLLSELRRGERDLLVVSRVADEGIDLPDVETAIVASGLGGSRRQGTQRAGRTMRPLGRARMYVLATRGTEEEEFARGRTRHLASKGVRVRETEADVEIEGEGEDEDGDGEPAAVDATGDDPPATAGEAGTDEDD
jgi:DNA excision repair protein ERCC-3